MARLDTRPRLTPADLRLARYAAGVHEAGHAAFIVALGAGEHIAFAEVTETREGNGRWIGGRCRHQLSFPDTPKGRIAGTALHLAGARAARSLLADPDHERHLGVATLSGGDAAKVAGLAATPEERAAAERWVGAVVLRYRAAILALARELAARGRLSGAEVLAVFHKA